jgi:hypothetical protein
MHKTLSLPAALSLFLLISCSNKDKTPCGGGPGVSCPLIDNLLFRFSIKDRSTGQDLFFSTPPTYPFSALKVTWTGGGTALQPQVDTLYSRHDFVMVAGQGRGSYTYYFKIANTKSDTLVYTANTYQASCCEDSTVLTNITFNGQMISRSLNLSTAVDLTPLVFYK